MSAQSNERRDRNALATAKPKRQNVTNADQRTHFAETIGIRTVPFRSAIGVSLRRK